MVKSKYFEGITADGGMREEVTHMLHEKGKYNVRCERYVRIKRYLFK